MDIFKRLFSYAEERKAYMVLAMILSGLATILSFVPYYFLWQMLIEITMDADGERISNLSYFIFGQIRTMLQGLFIAPSVVCGAIKGAILLGEVGEKLGFEVCPAPGEDRSDIIQAIKLKNKENMISFCKGIQKAAPVDSHVTPEPWAMPGYNDDVIMAAGAFVQGSSIELSADGPIREPFAVYFQGGLTYEHSKFGIIMALNQMYEDGLLDIN